MKINQQLVNEIVDRARQSDYGLSPGLTHKNGHLRVEEYGHDADALARLLVNGFDSKYDLISAFAAALQVVEEQAVETMRSKRGEMVID